MHFSMTDDLLEATLLGWSVRSVLWTFFLSGLLGTVIETIYCAAKWGVLECRNGVVHMPFGPIYGLAGTAMTLALTPLMVISSWHSWPPSWSAPRWSTWRAGSSSVCT